MSLWPCDVIWPQRSGSTSSQVKACCGTEPSHHLNQCWFINNEFLCILYNAFENYTFQITATSPADLRVNVNIICLTLLTGGGGGLFIHSQTFGMGLEWISISLITLLSMWLLIHAGIKANHVSKKGLCGIGFTPLASLNNSYKIIVARLGTWSLDSCCSMPKFSFICRYPTFKLG